MVPVGNVSPESCEEVKVDTPQLSDAVGAVQVTSEVHAPASESWLMLEGMPAITGASSSVTVTVKVLVAVLPEASAAV